MHLMLSFKILLEKALTLGKVPTHSLGITNNLAAGKIPEFGSTCQDILSLQGIVVGNLEKYPNRKKF